MKKWEYKCVRLSKAVRAKNYLKENEEILGELGAEGWKLRDVHWKSIGKPYAILLREVPSQGA